MKKKKTKRKNPEFKDKLEIFYLERTIVKVQYSNATAKKFYFILDGTIFRYNNSNVCLLSNKNVELQFTTDHIKKIKNDTITLKGPL